MTRSARRMTVRVASSPWVLVAGIAFCTHGFATASAAAAEFGAEELPSPAALEVFQSQVRPLLAQYCYSCHSGETAEGKLALDAYQDGADAGQRFGPLANGCRANGRWRHASRRRSPARRRTIGKPGRVDRAASGCRRARAARAIPAA